MDAEKVDRRSRFVSVYRMKPEHDMSVSSHGIALLLSWADHSRFFGIAAIAALLTSRGVVHVECNLVRYPFCLPYARCIIFSS
jgi:hypothetical protein